MLLGAVLRRESIAAILRAKYDLNQAFIHICRIMFSFSSSSLSFSEKCQHFPLNITILIIFITSIGFVMLYSAADGNFTPWTIKQVIRFIAGVLLMIGVSFINIRFWLNQAYIIYAASFFLLACVEILGFVGMGAQRWVDLYVFQLQPSEIMKISLVLALARYFHLQEEEKIYTVKALILPAVLVLLPTLLILRQPDLGTAIILLLVGAILFFAAGVRLWIFGVVMTLCAGILPFLWSLLRPYQKKRIMIFWDPETDPLGAGYHILQSKIALGSGGLYGKGFMAGTQSHLNFLPEKQTDFIFTMFCEEFGFFGGVFLLLLYALILFFSYRIIFRTRYVFTHLLSIGVTTTFFLHVLINVAMVMGLLPVVGVPLPLVSYGGTSLLTLLIGFGLLFSVSIHQEVRLPGASMQMG